jgi:hypothetical protein
VSQVSTQSGTLCDATAGIRATGGIANNVNGSQPGTAQAMENGGTCSGSRHKDEARCNET